MGLFRRRSSNFNHAGPNKVIGANPNMAYVETPLWGRFTNGYDVPNSYAVPEHQIWAGGNPVQRQMHPTAPQIVAPQTAVTVAIQGDGSQLTGILVQTPLIDLNNQAPGN